MEQKHSVTTEVTVRNDSYDLHDMCWVVLYLQYKE